MLPPVCFTCGRLFADFSIPYDNDTTKIDNDTRMTNDEKNNAKAALLDKYHIKSYCCRARVLGQCNLTKLLT